MSENSDQSKKAKTGAERVTIYLRPETKQMLGAGRQMSEFVRNVVERLDEAGTAQSITNSDRQEFKIRVLGAKDQTEALHWFAEATGRSLADAVVALNLIEREYTEPF